MGAGGMENKEIKCLDLRSMNACSKLKFDGIGGIRSVL